MSLVTIWNESNIKIDTYSEKINLENYFTPELKDLFFQSAIVNSSAMLRPE